MKFNVFVVDKDKFIVCSFLAKKVFWKFKVTLICTFEYTHTNITTFIQEINKALVHFGGKTENIRFNFNSN